MFRRLSDNQRWEETTFRGRDYWVQTVAKTGSETTTYFAVTSCSLGFNPSFVLPDGTSITLNRARLSEVQLSDVFGPPFADYFAPAATANAHFYDFAYGGNPGNYKTFAWGYNDACLNLPLWTRGLNDGVFKLFGFDGTFQGPIPRDEPELERFRRTLLVNTYAETTPLEDFSTGTRAFQVGVDRILIRTVVPEYRPRAAVPTRSGGYVDEYERIGSTPRMNAVAQCFRSPLMLSAFIIGGWGHGSYTTSDERRLLSYVGGSFFVVHGAFPGRERFADQELTVFFPKPRAVRSVADAIRRRERGVVRIERGTILLWKQQPNADERGVAERCLLA